MSHHIRHNLSILSPQFISCMKYGCVKLSMCIHNHTCMCMKVPTIEKIEKGLFSMLKQCSEKLVKRRQEDIKDQSQDYTASEFLSPIRIAHTHACTDTTQHHTTRTLKFAIHSCYRQACSIIPLQNIFL